MNSAKPRVLSGMQPTSDSLHLGNYLGALTQWRALQDEYEALYCVVDLHSLTVEVDPDVLRQRTRVTAAQYLAGGVDPAKSTLFVQSHVRAHAELAWVLSCFTGFGEASRMTQFKDKSAQHGNAKTNVGLFTYPILMASDILLYDTAKVPVGDDQRQHLELTRDLAIRLNGRFGGLFTVPEGYIVKETARIMDLQEPTKKMSKSAASPKGLINMLDDPAANAKKVRSAVTDTDTVIEYDAEAKPGVANLLSIYSALTGESVDAIVARFNGKMYGHLKVAVAEALVEVVTPFRDQTLAFLADPAELDRILQQGADKARGIADATLARVYDAVGFVPALRGE
ncbi:tryptophan--tRNA ligase [Micrococcales bacterium 31B]|nr:tryptophan--tRNA ligase [Micrococcales bacterium 31B]